MTEHGLLPLLGLLHPEASPDDVVVVGGSIGDVMNTAAALVAEGKLAVVLMSPPRRRRLRARLRRSGLQADEILLRGPNELEQVVSVHGSALSLALRLGPPTAWKARLLPLLPQGLVQRVVALMPRVALVVHSRSTPLMRWLSALDPARGTDRRAFVLALSPDRTRAQAYGFAAGDELPQTLAKAALTDVGAERISREARALREVAPAAGGAGVQVPELLDSTRIGGMPVLLESFVSGEPAATLIAVHPDCMERVVGRLADWLARWATATATAAVLSSELLDASLLGPVNILADALPGSFVQSIRTEANHLAGSRATTTAAHNDLTMYNVLVRADGEIGVLDWEAATPAALPLTDLFYALVDAVSAQSGYVDRRDAFRACFRVDGPRAVWARSIVEEQIRVLGISRKSAALAFRSCWLQHGANDARRGNGGFVTLLRDLAGAPETFWPMYPRAD